MRFYKRMEPATVVPRMIPSEKLDGMVQPSDRLAASPQPWLPRMIATSAHGIWEHFQPGRS